VVAIGAAGIRKLAVAHVETRFIASASVPAGAVFCPVGAGEQSRVVCTFSAALPHGEATSRQLVRKVKIRLSNI
jgi:hypothetical protein